MKIPPTAASLHDETGSSDGQRMLTRIADVLRRPVSDFYRREDASAGSTAPSAEECAVLLDAFARVTDPEARTRIVALLRTLAAD